MRNPSVCKAVASLTSESAYSHPLRDRSRGGRPNTVALSASRERPENPLAEPLATRESKR